METPDKTKIKYLLTCRLFTKSVLKSSPSINLPQYVFFHIVRRSHFLASNFNHHWTLDVSTEWDYILFLLVNCYLLWKVWLILLSIRRVTDIAWVSETFSYSFKQRYIARIMCAAHFIAFVIKHNKFNVKNIQLKLELHDANYAHYFTWKSKCGISNENINHALQL